MKSLFRLVSVRLLRICDLNYIVSTLYEYRERRKKLQTPSEKSKLLGNVPQVIPDVHEHLDSNTGDITNSMNSDKGSQQSILQRKFIN